MNKSRRSFLKVAGLSAFALSSGVAALDALAGNALAQVAPGRYERADHALHAKRWAMVIDTRQFAGPATRRTTCRTFPTIRISSGSGSILLSTPSPMK